MTTKARSKKEIELQIKNNKYKRLHYMLEENLKTHTANNRDLVRLMSQI
jgi:hypothetical protein